MKNFKTFFIYESEQFFCLRNSVLTALMLVLSLIFVQVGVARYKNAQDKKQEFREIEKQKIDQYITYTQYGTYGFRCLFIHDPLSILLTNSGVITDMEGFVDSGERLNIYVSLLGKNLFTIKRKWPVDFAGLILFFGSLLSLLYGFDTFPNKEYPRFLSALVGHKQVFIYMLATRLILLLLLFLAVFGCGLAVVFLNGIVLAIDGHSLILCLLMLIAAVGFFAVGALFGSLKFDTDAVSYAISCWLILLLVVPAAIDSLVEAKANKIISIYRLELKKFNIVMNFEKRAIAKAGTFNYGKEPTDRDRELVRGYRENDFKKIQALEEDLKKQMQESIALYHWLSILTPAAFYLSVTNEASGDGYTNAIDYFGYVQQLKREFVNFYIKKIYFENFATVEPFIKDDQNVYIARPRLSGYVAWGLLLNVLYIGLFLWAAYCRYKKISAACDTASRSTKAAPSHTLKLVKGDFKVWDVRGDLFRCQLYNLLSGETGSSMDNEPVLQMSIADRPLGTDRQKENFFYLCHSLDLPGKVKAGNFLCFIADLIEAPGNPFLTRQALIEKNIDPLKKIKRLSQEELGKLMVCLLELKPFDIYLVNDIARGMSPEFALLIKEKFEKLAADGAVVFFINTAGQFWSRTNASSRYFIELPVWGKVVDSLIEK